MHLSYHVSGVEVVTVSGKNRKNGGLPAEKGKTGNEAQNRLEMRAILKGQDETAAAQPNNVDQQERKELLEVKNRDARTKQLNIHN